MTIIFRKGKRLTDPHLFGIDPWHDARNSHKEIL